MDSRYDIARPPHLGQTARPPLSHNNSLCCTPVLKRTVNVLKVVQALSPPSPTLCSP